MKFTLRGKRIQNGWLALSLIIVGMAAGAAEYLSPVDLAASPDGRTLYVAAHTANKLLVYDVVRKEVTRRVTLPAPPTGLALSRDGAELYITCAAPAGTLVVMATSSGKISQSIPVGHYPMAPVPSPDGSTIYLCHRFQNEVAAISLKNRRPVFQVRVPREPYAADLTPDGRWLYVANHLQDGRADIEIVAAKVSIIDTTTRQLAGEISLPNGSGLLCGLRVSPNGRWVAVTHTLARYHLPTTQLERGWMNTSAITLIDTAARQAINTVLVDSVDSGAANPYAVAWSADSATLYVTHAGTHELSVIDAAGLLKKLAAMPTSVTNGQTIDYTAASRVAADVPNDLSFLVGLRTRVKLQAYGPRSLAVVGRLVYTGNYFSDNLSVVDTSAPVWRAQALPLGPEQPMDVLRLGEFYFNDATICFQGWQTCASCHSFDARVDGLNWDLLNDGIGNPKNSKSLLLSHRTPPAMSMGVRDTAETAVRAGIRHILFTVQPESVPTAMDEWLKTLKPLPSPHLENGKLSKAAERGRKLFLSAQTGCAQCHPPGLYTDMKHYDVGTQGPLDRSAEFDTPTLIELWRTAPYLHDGSARTIQEVLTIKNRQDRHGKTSHLTPQQIEDLAAFVLSL
ncbi:c-type cytochrome [Fontisphaera persica]|uniref:c-type cytochrome n=1 Tax=Fontisphaera persica TaxID=2974023 RepID=UPI0024C01138|nr:c-type cytochrome [Fontisphaera persica]WCJ60274.1 c-type cytochrome [Fontisphaera persica]